MIAFPRLGEIAINANVLIFTLVVSLGSALLCGLAPTMSVTHLPYPDLLRGGGGSLRHGFAVQRSHRMQRVLVTAEIALATMLLVGAGLLMHSFMKLMRVVPGYNPSHVLTFQLGVPQDRYSAPQLTMVKDAVVARLQAVPGVRAAGYAQSLPMIRNSGFIPVRTRPELPDQIPPPPPGPPGSRLPPDRPNLRVVSKDFLTVLGVRVLAGRGFIENDRADHPRVMLINQALARSGVLGDGPLGAQLYAFGSVPWEIVGIVDDIHQVDLAQEPDPQVFVDYRQLPDRQPPYYAIRTDSEPTDLVPAIRAAVRQLDPVMTVDHIATMEQLLSNSIARPRFYAILFGIFAGVAVILAVVGLSGVIAYAVSLRTTEIGIRMALGARRGHVLRLILGQSARLTALGLIVGLAGAAMLTRYLSAMLFGLSSLDPMTFAAASLLFAGVAMMATYLPARRAARLDPLLALREN